MNDVLSEFHPVIRGWFALRYGRPTPVQEAAWPRILAGEHVLVTAPTGSGKTLTAFLAALDALLTGRWPAGSTSVVYVSPLKALNNDIERNLIAPLAELGPRFSAAGIEAPQIRVFTRSGDTPADDRRRMVRRPPEILITTPESLNLLLSASSSREVLTNVRLVILDEIHAIVGGKRGTHLITAVERLAILAGEFQRVAVSATVRPPATVAEFVGGHEPVGPLGRTTAYRPRPVVIVSAPDCKRIELSVDIPSDKYDQTEFWPRLAAELRSTIDANRSTLVFVNSRRHAERITLLLNEGLDEPIAYSHHGSLSRELRHFVEQSLKAGKLRAIVATSSLELGIDIGELDQVVLVQTPPGVAATLQRVGRAGHQVDATSRGALYALNGRDLVDAAVVSMAVADRAIEESRPIRSPLDVLAQIIVGMTLVETWRIDALYAALRTSWPYHELDRRQFELVLEMLAGRYADTRIASLQPRVTVDRVAGTVRARDGSRVLLYQSGGTIPDRGYFGLRVPGGGKVGELDEEFVWERRVGETFVLGTQAWTITAITDRDVEVVPARPGADQIPFWRATARGRDVTYCFGTLDFLDRCNRSLETDAIGEVLSGVPGLSGRSCTALEEFLVRQRAVTGVRLPGRRHAILERLPYGSAEHRHRRSRRAEATEGESLVILHLMWGGRVLWPLGILLEALLEEELGPVETQSNDDCIAFRLPDTVPAKAVFGSAVCRRLISADTVERLLRERLESSGVFGAHFRENAGRALLLPRGGFDRRLPLWLARERARRLHAAVAGFDDFPILVETWRTCLRDEFDLPALRTLLEEVADGVIEVIECRTDTPSPFSSSIIWQHTNTVMYRDDTSPALGRSALADNLVREAALSGQSRPHLPPALVDEALGRLQRTAPEYTPATAQELVEWIEERLLLTPEEAARLADAVRRDHGGDAVALGPLVTRLAWLRTPSGARLLCAVARLPAVRALYAGDLPGYAPAGREWYTAPETYGSWPEPHGPEPESLPEATPASVLLELLRFHGPRPLRSYPIDYGISASAWEEHLASLVESEQSVVGRLVDGAVEDEVCDLGILEYLLRLLRRSIRPVFDAVPASHLIPLWTELTGLGAGGSADTGLVEVLDALFGYPAPAGLWESDLFPARLDYYPQWLDALFNQHQLYWFGCGPRQMSFALADELPLFLPPAPPMPSADGGETLVDRVVSSLGGGRDFLSLAAELGLTSDAIAAALWEATWAGRITNDSIETLRRGIRTGFSASAGDAAPDPAGSAAARWSGRRVRGLREWQATRPLSGRWLALPQHAPDDPMTAMEEEKDRARLFLNRYGLLFRELLERESPHLQWRRLFRALRLMELSGEVSGGRFVDGASLPQFALPAALETLAAAGESRRVVWMSALDPASPCALGLAAHFPDLPTRTPGTHLVFRGTELVLVSRRGGVDLTVFAEPGDPDFPSMLEPLRVMVSRRWEPRARVAVERVNGVPVRESPYAPALSACGFRDEFRTFVLSASYR